ncbi:SGNH/GDSL hydrolase family protein [Tunturibacter empetritectus]|uniref:SGNH hydrolase-type esterase domain-containing protein n=2 Tax=Tunturiibacter empetritectus TaxID=3069691 RepID=A0A7W8IG59_9BACT|nr:SGNH/GDSL hydrolase family protein [Edaphobacter lichenicola]MBB5315608.1 hypothetical protein [Edaphobacter lichenicola]
MSTMVTLPKDQLPRRDLFVLPALSILTLLVLLIASEAAARFFFPEQKTDYCEIPNARLGFSYKPGCITHVKAAEGPWVINQYNDCGYRSRESCGPKPSGTTRIALIGSSIAEGWLVGYDQSFNARTAKDLTARCHRPVEIQNLGRQACSLTCISRRADEALALKPDVLLMTINASDIETLTEADMATRFQPTVPAHKDPATEKRSPVRRIKSLFAESRAMIVIEHYLFQDAATYLRLALINTNATGFLHTPFNSAWEQRFHNLDILLSETAAKAHEANVPFVLVEFPSAAQTAALVLNDPAQKLDPDAINTRLAQISSSHGIKFVNTLNAFRETPASNKLYYLADGHLDGEGQALISGPLVEQLTDSSDPVIAGCPVLHAQGPR